jgi:nucleoside-diphosphate-sugar epimerase
VRVLLLGGTGFIGQASRRALGAAGHDVVVAGRSPAADVRLDATDDDAVGRLLSDPYDCTVNLLGAGLDRSSADHETMRRINTDLPARLLDRLSILAGPTALVHAASSTERRQEHHPHESDYSRSKHGGAALLRAAAGRSGIPVTILTIHNTYGPGQPTSRFVAAMIDELRAGHPVRLVHPDRIRDFVFVDDVAASIRHAVEHPGQDLTEADIGTGVGTRLELAARTIAGALGRPADLVRATPGVGDDPNPTTVGTVRFGTYGLCTTDFDRGLATTLEET